MGEGNIEGEGLPGIRVRGSKLCFSEVTAQPALTPTLLVGLL